MNDKRLTGAFNLIACDARLAGRTTGAPRVTHTLQVRYRPVFREGDIDWF